MYLKFVNCVKPACLYSRNYFTHYEKAWPKIEIVVIAIPAWSRIGKIQAHSLSFVVLGE